MPAAPENGCLPVVDPVPRIIPRSEHAISRKNIDREALKVLYRLRDAGHTAYLVGGGVRDLYLGKTPKDFDISTDARPGQLRKIFRNSRLIGRRFRLVQVFFPGGKIIEVSTFRRRNEYDEAGNGDSREAVLAADNTFGNPAEDAFRRDLTINALFYEIENFSIIDYTGGVDDLNRGIIRMIGDPDRRFARDPVRMLRVIRHAARNNFMVEEKTWLAMARHCQELTLCPVSRIRDEFFRDLHGSASQPWARLAMDSGIFVVLLPFYKKYLLDDAADTTRVRLLANLGIIDRIHGQGALLPDHLLLALLLLPWAKAELNLAAAPQKGPQAHQFSRLLRARIDEILVPLNISRAVKEVVALLLANLPLFEQEDRKGSEGGWPKWLKKKSYFKDCERFYRLLHEVDRSPQPLAPIDPELVNEITRPASRKSAKRRPSHRGSRGPAFASNSGGGIFGLKKR
ncbi:MAG: poly(A) polymerase [Deltaproteobacteria bacterium RIFOXYD12_FULL_57_12]|nr:MAG: poly(A) polymerase [Deltaproteobacteria bacterium RIFOXYD12_FULL_57_12]